MDYRYSIPRPLSKPRSLVKCARVRDMPVRAAAGGLGRCRDQCVNRLRTVRAQPSGRAATASGRDSLQCLHALTIQVGGSSSSSRSVEFSREAKGSGVCVDVSSQHFIDFIYYIELRCLINSSWKRYGCSRVHARGAGARASELPPNFNTMTATVLFYQISISKMLHNVDDLRAHTHYTTVRCLRILHAP